MRRISEYDETYLRNQKPAWLWLKILAAAVFVAVTVGATAWACGWVKTGAEVVGPTNVKEQWRFAYDYTESLNGIAGNWCTAKQVEDSTTDSAAKDQRVSQRIAHEQNYRRVQNEYDARLADAFRAKLVKPADVPNRAPTLQETVAALGCATPTP